MTDSTPAQGSPEAEAREANKCAQAWERDGEVYVCQRPRSHRMHGLPSPALAYSVHAFVERDAIRKDAEERIKALLAALDPFVPKCGDCGAPATLSRYIAGEQIYCCDAHLPEKPHRFDRRMDDEDEARARAALLAEDASPVAPRTPTTCYHYIERTPRYRDGDTDSVCGQPLPCPDHPGTSKEA